MRSLSFPASIACNFGDEYDESGKDRCFRHDTHRLMKVDGRIFAVRLESFILRFFFLQFRNALADLVDDLLSHLRCGSEGLFCFLVLRVQRELFEAGLSALQGCQASFHLSRNGHFGHSPPSSRFGSFLSMF